MPLNLPFTAGRADDPKLYEWMRAVGQQALKSQDMAATYPVTVSRGTPGTPVTYGLSSPLKWPIADKGGQVFNVLSYGATLDGKTDDTLALNAAISAASASGAGGQVLIPLCSGGLRFTSGITIPKGVSLVGTNAPNGTLSSKLIADLTGTAITFSATGASNYYSFIQDIDLRKGTSNPSTLILFNNIWFAYINRLYTQGGSSEAIKFTGSNAHIALQNILFQSSPNVCVRFGSGAASDSNNAIYMSGNEFSGAAAGAVVVNSVLSHITSVADVYEGNTGAGLRIEASATAGENLFVAVNPYFEGNTGYDIDLNPSGTAVATSQVCATVIGGHFNGTGVGPGALRVNSQATSVHFFPETSFGHTTAGVVLGSLAASVASRIFINGHIYDTTKISSTNPTTSGDQLYFCSQDVIRQVVGGAGTGVEIMHGYSKATTGPRYVLENLDATSNNSALVHKARGTELWRLNVDNPGGGGQNWTLVDSVNAKNPIWVTGNSTTGFVGIGNVTSPTVSCEIGGAMAVHRGSVTLVNGANNDIAIPANSYVRITGPTGAFSVSGFTGGADGRVLYLFNPGNNTMTITNQAGSAAANQIFTCTGANVVLRAGAPSFATFIYDTANSFWVLMSTN